MSSTEIGRNAETHVASQLSREGFRLRDKNWRTKYCEIDLVMEKKSTMYFIEVKYRTSDSYGGGLDYITPKKLKQMRFAAELWIANNSWNGDASLGAVEVYGKLDAPVLLIDIE